MKLKYKTEMFGQLPKGSTIKLKCLLRTKNHAVIYARPKPKKNECGCIIIVKKEGDVWVDIDANSYINISENTLPPIDFIDKNILDCLSKMEEERKRKKSGQFLI